MTCNGAHCVCYTTLNYFMFVCLFYNLCVTMYIKLLQWNLSYSECPVHVHVLEMSVTKKCMLIC